MQRLLIIRHAIAHPRDSNRWPNDNDRPLTGAGKKRFRKAARGIGRLFGSPDELLSSTLVRAMQTARILERRAAFPATVELHELGPEIRTSVLIAALQKRRAKFIAIVGHEPSLSALAGELLKDRLDAPLKKGGALMIAFKGRLGPHKGKLVAFVTPRVLVRSGREVSSGIGGAEGLSGR